MRVCIIGCGAIGSIFGSHLAMHDHVEVWAYDKDQKHVDAINQQGLSLTGLTDFTAQVFATSSAQDIPPCDFGIIATKVYHTRDAIAATAHALREGIICSLQNGIGNEAILAADVPDVISGTTLVGGHVAGAGEVNFDTNGKTWLAPSEGHAPFEKVQYLAGLLSAKGLETEAISDVRGVKWSKLIFNAAANSLCALTRLPFGNVYASPELKKLLLGVAQEGIAVAVALGIELETDPIEMLEQASLTASQHQPSMLTDVLNHRKTEVQALNGGIVEQGQRLGIACPLNELLTGLIAGLELSWR